MLLYALNTLLPAVRQIVSMPIASSWATWTSRVPSSRPEKMANLETTRVFERWIYTAWSRLCDATWELVHCYFVSSRTFSDHTPGDGISFCVQLQVMHIFRQIMATRAASWLLAAAVTFVLGNRSTGNPANNEAHPTRELHGGGSHEEQYIYWLVREIVNNCSAHWSNYGGEGCHLEEGATPAEIQKLDSLLDKRLPTQYKAFLRLTNGLSHVLDGSSKHIDFMSAADSISWVREMYRPSSSGTQTTQELWATWLIESMLGPGAREELTEQMTDHDVPKSCVRLIKIASHDSEAEGLFLVSPEDCGKMARDWFPAAFGDGGRRGSLIGRIEAHGETYFGDMGRRLETLRGCREWTVLQVRGRRYRLYPSFAAFLQTLAEVTRRTADELLVSGVHESQYANHCRWRWEQEWTRSSEQERRGV
ncbi:hypothetical protein F5Y14DRAFT_453865 [Nemania sp. NC0429]|nr:hypothetical protein F5Y14DRAFT_453865 [Nemania sp. NC0429]